MKILILKKLLITEVSGGLSYHYLPKIHQKVIADDGKTVVTRSSVRHLINFSLPTLNIQKPKSFPMASGNLDLIMPVIKSFDKRPSIIKTKAKALDLTFHLRKTSCNEVEKIVCNLNIKNSYQQDVPTKIIKLNKDLIAEFIAENFNSCIDEGEFPSGLNMPILSQFIKRKIRVTNVIKDQ